MSNASDTRARAARLRLMAFDVDGVMTDGGLTYADDGSESKTFNVRDGLGLKLLQDGGIEVAVITGRQSPCVAARMDNLGITHHVPLAEAPKAYETFRDKKDGCIKVVIRP